jgi:hypothetical protein
VLKRITCVPKYVVKFLSALFPDPGSVKEKLLVGAPFGVDVMDYLMSGGGEGMNRNGIPNCKP